MGQLGIHHDSLATKSLLSGCLKDSKLKLATGYFNLTETYMDTLTKDCQAECDILMAHPNVSCTLLNFQTVDNLFQLNVLGKRLPWC